MLNIVPHFMPSYSPEFNSIEALWGWVKRDVKKRMAFKKFVNVKQHQFEKLLQECLNSITYEMQSRAAMMNNRDFLHRILGQCLEREEFPHLFMD